MGNLGYYQVMTALAKKMGGPLALAAATAASELRDGPLR